MIKFDTSELAVIRELSEVDVVRADKLNIYGDDETSRTTPDERTGTLLKAWVSLKREMYLAMCTTDPRYAKLRKMTESLESESTTAAAMIVSAVTIGLPAAILVPVAKVVVVATFRLGLNVFCKVNESDKVLGRLTQREQQVLKELYRESA